MGFGKIKPSTVSIMGTVVDEKTLYYYNIYNTITSLTNYLKRKVIGMPVSESNYNAIKIPQENEITNAASLLKTLHYQINGKDIDFKAIIPFELEITLDGIGGLVVGQIFTVNKDILPKDYYNKNLGFIITGISHMLQNNDWATTIKTQVCLLDNDAYAPAFDKKILKETLEQIKIQASENVYIAYAMADYLVYSTLRTLGKPDHFKQPFISGNKGLMGNISFDRIKNDDIPYIINTITEYGALDFDRYLEAWFNTASKDKLEGFPQSLKDLKDIVLPDGNILPTAQLFGNFVNNVFLKGYGSGKKNSDYKPEDIFLFRIFGKDNTSDNLQKQIVGVEVSPETETYYETVNKVINLDALYVIMLKQVTDFIEQSNYKVFINPREPYSLEAIKTKKLTFTTSGGQVKSIK